MNLRKGRCKLFIKKFPTRAISIEDFHRADFLEKYARSFERQFFLHKETL